MALSLCFNFTHLSFHLSWNQQEHFNSNICERLKQVHFHKYWICFLAFLQLQLLDAPIAMQYPLHSVQIHLERWSTSETSLQHTCHCCPPNSKCHNHWDSEGCSHFYLLSPVMTTITNFLNIPHLQFPGNIPQCSFPESQMEGAFFEPYFEVYFFWEKVVKARVTSK